jgi:hypothetical protein
VQDIYRTDNLTRQRKYDDCCFAVACGYRTFHLHAADRTVRLPHPAPPYGRPVAPPPSSTSLTLTHANAGSRAGG